MSEITVKEKFYIRWYLTRLHLRVLRLSKTTTGFTLLEMLVVVLIIGILSAIAAPSWLAFVNRQRVNKVSDVILSTLQDAQRQAKKNKRSYSVWFQEEMTTKELQYATVPTKQLDGTGTELTSNDIKGSWKRLGEDVGVNSKQFLMSTNITANNTASTVTYAQIKSPTKYITFDYMGALPDAKSLIVPDGSKEPPGLRFMVAVPKSPNSTEPGDTKRCVVIQTILGGIRTAKDEDCDK